MWRYVLIHTLWFAILFLVHIFGNPRDRGIVAGCVALVAAALAWQGAMDPFAWLYYTAYTVVVFVGAGGFRAWSLERLDVLSVRLQRTSRQLDESKNLLAHRRRETEVLDRRARQIFELYERVKEMSRCLDPVEAFLVLGESLAEHFPFETVKLALFNSSDPKCAEPTEFYELRYEALTATVNHTAILADRTKLRAEVFPFDERVFRHFFSMLPKPGTPRRNALSGDRPAFPCAFTAFPVYVRDHPAAVLTIIGVDAQDLPLYYILIERFAGELQRIHLYGQVQLLATHDGLTDTYVRRHLLERLEDETARCRRQNLPIAFLMIDVDHFKRINDQFGHLTGDAVLKDTARVIKKSVREADLVGRYGGEEFGVVLSETDEAAARVVAERIRRSVEENEIVAYDAKHRVTVSIGLSVAGRGQKDAKTMTDEADKALYRAKRGGRNRVC